MKTLWLLHGVNLDMLGHRDPAQYGTLTLPELEAYVVDHAAARGFAVRCYQTNHEGGLVEKIHEIVREGPDAVIVNPGAWTHYSYAVRDALELVEAVGGDLIADTAAAAARRLGAEARLGFQGASLSHEEYRRLRRRYRGRLRDVGGQR